MPLRHAANLTAIDQLGTWTLPGLSPLVASDAADRLEEALQTYLDQDGTGLSVLIAGNRGVGKTTLVERAIEKCNRAVLRRETEAAQLGRGQYLARMPRRPFLVRVHGPGLLLDRLPGPKSRSDGQVEQARHGEGSERDRPTLEQAILVQLVIALYRALVAECGVCFDRHAAGMQKAAGTVSEDLATRAGLAARVRLFLDEAPEPGLLNGLWRRFGVRDGGVIWPDPVGQLLAGRGLPGQGAREIVAIATAAQLYEVSTGKVEFTRLRKDNNRSEQGGKAQGETWSGALDRLPGLGTGALITGGLASASGFSATVSLIAALAGALAVGGVKIVRQREKGSDYAVTVDRSSASLVHLLPVAIGRLGNAGLVPIFVVDELDKLNPDQLELVMETLARAKQIVTDRSCFCFVTNRPYYQKIERLLEEDRDALEYSFFTLRLYILQRPEDLDAYIERILEPVAETLIGDARQANLRSRLILKKVILFHARSNAVELRRVLTTGFNQKRDWIEDEVALRTELRWQLKAVVQIAIEASLRIGRAAEKAEQDGLFRQHLLQALYLLADDWIEGKTEVALDEVSLGPRLKGAEDDKKLLVSALRKLAERLSDFAALLAECNNDASLPQSDKSLLPTVIPAGESLIFLRSHLLAIFKYNERGDRPEDKAEESLEANEMREIRAAVEFTKGLLQGLVDEGFTPSVLTIPSIWSQAFSAEVLIRAFRIASSAESSATGAHGLHASLSVLQRAQGYFEANQGRLAETLFLVAFSARAAGVKRQDALGPVVRLLPRSGRLEVEGDGLKQVGLTVGWSPARLQDFRADAVTAWIGEAAAAGAAAGSKLTFDGNWQSAWERRARMLSSAWGPDTLTAVESPRFDFILAGMSTAPLGILLCHSDKLGDISAADWAILAMEALNVDPGQASPSGGAPGWVASAALFALGFGRDVLDPLMARFASFEVDQYPTGTALASALASRAPATAPGTLLIHGGDFAAAAQPPADTAPVFYVHQDQLQTYDTALRRLSELRAFARVLDEQERTRSEGPRT